MNDNAIKVAKINVFDAHDRLKELQKSFNDTLAQGCEDCLKQNVLSLALQEKSPYIYIFAHPRTEPNGNMKRMYWQPRISRPLPQTNSYLFRAQSKSDVLEICWMLPPMETWNNFRKGNVTENDIVEWSIGMYLHNRQELKKPHPDDMSEEAAKGIFYKVIMEMENKKWKMI